MMNKRILSRLTAVLLFSAVSYAQTSGEPLQQALYAEQIEGDLPAAIALYQKIIDDANAPSVHVAQALYHQGMCYVQLKQNDNAQVILTRLCTDCPDQIDLVEKARSVLDSLNVFDLATLMPPETLAYLELGSTGKQLETVLEMLKGTPLEDPLLALSQNNPNALNSGAGPLVAGLMNPAMKEDFCKIRGLAVGLVDITPDAPSLVGVLHLGNSSMLRGLLMTGLSMAARPGPVVEGVQTYSMQGGPVDVACDDNVFLLSFQGRHLPWMIRQYKHLLNDTSLASGNPSFQKLDKVARQQNLATLWVNVNGTYPRLTQLMNSRQIERVDDAINMNTIDDLTLSAAFSADTLSLDGRLRFNFQNLTYESIQTPTISRIGMKGVPADAIGLLSFDFANSNSMQGIKLMPLVWRLFKIHLPTEVMDSIEQVTLFALPRTEVENSVGMPIQIGIVIQCRDMAPVVPFVESIRPMLKTMDVLEVVNDSVIYGPLDSAGVDAVKAALADAPSAADVGRLSAKVKQLAAPAGDAEKLAVVSVGGAVRLMRTKAHYPEEIISEEIKQQLEDGFENLGQALDGTTLSIHTEEESREFEVQVCLSDIPAVTNIVAAAQEIIKAQAQINEKMAQVRAEEQRKAEEQRRKELEEQLAKLVPAEVPHTAAAPVLDGDLDDLWKLAPAYAVEKVNSGINEREQGEPISGCEFGADFRMLWDEQNLYVFMDVTDSTPNRNPEIGWQFSDNIILYIDATDAKLDHFSQTDYEYAFCWDEVRSLLREPKHDRMNNVVYDVKTTDKGYSVEVAFPWDTLGTPNPAAGTVIGIDVQASDNQAGPKRNLLLGWQDDQNRAWQMPSTFGRAKLIGTGE